MEAHQVHQAWVQCYNTLNSTSRVWAGLGASESCRPTQIAHEASGILKKVGNLKKHKVFCTRSVKMKRSWQIKISMLPTELGFAISCSVPCWTARLCSFEYWYISLPLSSPFRWPEGLLRGSYAQPMWNETWAVAVLPLDGCVCNWGHTDTQTHGRTHTPQTPRVCKHAHHANPLFPSTPPSP